METTFQYTLEESRLHFLSYLWGMETCEGTPYIFPFGSFLSYLWGMETLSQGILTLSGYAFYPTYEEWKLCRYNKIWRVINPFYPTYEEWKHISSK
mgnify:CR=1 FL=1